VDVDVIINVDDSDGGPGNSVQVYVDVYVHVDVGGCELPRQVRAPGTGFNENWWALQSLFV
jgi:hypothetical protein